MKKILFYCQYLAGMGHLVRSTEIIRRLVQDFQVCLVNGGQAVPGFEFPPLAEVVYLPAVWEDDNELKPVDSSQTIEEVKESRKQKLLAVLEQFEPDFLITECFPFSKHKLSFELIPLLDNAQASERPIQIICSLRDLIMTQPMSEKARAKRQQKVCKLINRYYDMVLFHSDRSLLRLEDCFPLVEQLTCEVYYTGYVAPLPPAAPLIKEDNAALSQEEPMIVASVGGGRHGYELLNAIASATSLLNLPHKIHAFAGPFMAEAEFQSLQQMTTHDSSFILRRFTSRLSDYMLKADLSISLGGYNTMINILRTRVRSLVLPSLSEHQTGEQSIRAQKLAQKGIINLLHPAELAPDCLAAKITACLQAEPVGHSLDLEGATKVAARLKEINGNADLTQNIPAKNAVLTESDSSLRQTQASTSILSPCK
ncbi:MAG: glycosyltransferase family protein [Cyanophyceae cyanobacterium]